MAQTLDKKLYSLQISTTAKCNMACSFCKSALPMEQPEQSNALQYEQIKDIVNLNPQLTHYVWGGGEPLLAIRKLKRIVNMCRNKTPNAEQQLLSNGRKLRLVDLEFLQSFDTVSVSIDGFEKGERTLMGFVNDNDHEALEVMHKLNNVTTWGVVTNEQLWTPRWYEDMIKLHTAIHHLGFRSYGILLDIKMTKPLFTDQVLNFVYGWKRLRENLEMLNATYGTDIELSIPGVFDHYNCSNCSTGGVIDPDGTFTRPADPEIVVDGGCNKLAPIFGIEAYKYITKFLNAVRHEDAY